MSKSKQKEALNLRKKGGITLIALVVSIVVILILAGISINLISGEEGIINSAITARERTNTKNLKEEVKLALETRKIDKYKKMDLPPVREYLNEVSGATITKAFSDTWYVERDGAVITVYDDESLEEGKVLIWDGSSSESPEFKEFNWYIYNPAQFKFLADYVNNGKTLTTEQETMLTEKGYSPSDVTMTEETTVYLMKDIDLGARPINGNWETEENEARKWTPIGIDKEDKKFIATFEGNEHFIRGVYVNRPEESWNGIFANSYSISNLTIKASYIKGYWCNGGIVGALRSGEVKNCHNIGSTIYGTYRETGGVVGQSEGIVKNCTNTGDVTGSEDSTGGVLGFGWNSSSVINCMNSGTVTGIKSTGGVVGQNSLCPVSNCTNSGAVTGEGSCTGGIVGQANLSSSSPVINCMNSGAVTGGWYTGGVVGIADTVSNCTNSGPVKGNLWGVGGVVGMLLSNVEKCINTGVIKQTGVNNGALGGVVGYIYKNCTATIKNCYNIGKIIEEAKNVQGVGGVLGYVDPTGTSGEISHNYNIGEIEINGTNVTHVGGVIGRLTTSTFTKNHNYYITGKSNVTLNTHAEAMAESDMKTAEFVAKLNESLETPVWEIRAGENEGYPVLKKEE